MCPFLCVCVAACTCIHSCVCACARVCVQIVENSVCTLRNLSYRLEVEMPSSRLLGNPELDALLGFSSPARELDYLCLGKRRRSGSGSKRRSGWTDDKVSGAPSGGGPPLLRVVSCSAPLWWWPAATADRFISKRCVAVRCDADAVEILSDTRVLTVSSLYRCVQCVCVLVEGWF